MSCDADGAPLEGASAAGADGVRYGDGAVEHGVKEEDLKLAGPSAWEDSGRSTLAPLAGNGAKGHDGGAGAETARASASPNIGWSYMFRNGLL